MTDKPQTTYGYRINEDNGSVTWVDGCQSLEEAVNKCFDACFLGKYKEPAWWQFWKRNIRKECGRVIANAHN